MFIRDPPHFLSALKTTRTPKRLMFLDCVPDVIRRTDDTEMRWKCGALSTTHWTAKNNERKDWLDTYTDASELWAKCDDYCTKGRRVILFSYDLGHTLRVSQALVHLPALGWRLDKIILDRGASWALFRTDEKTLLCCDIKSWTSADWAKVSTAVGKPSTVVAEHPGKRKWSAAVAAHRCEIVRAFVLQLLEWIQDNDLGGFKPTGSGQSYSAYRRRFMRDRLLVHDDIARLDIERRALWAGRVEAWRHGKVRGGPFVEFDMRTAYCRIGAECSIPISAKSSIARPSASRIRDAAGSCSILARVRVETETPVVPTALGTRVAWPVGTFETWLWDPELLLAFDHCDKVTVLDAYKYNRSPALSTFCQWVLDTLTGPGSNDPSVATLVSKHWARTLIGRFALRYRSWERFSTNDNSDLRLVTYLDHIDGIKTDMLLVGGDRLILSEMVEGADSMPQIPGWVMSECRRRLWEVMNLVGLENVLYVDTDSVIVTWDAAKVIRDWTKTNCPGRWAEKGRYTSLTINGPRNLELNADRRMAGLPLDAVRVGEAEFQGDVLRSIRESMRSGKLDCVSSVPRRFVFDAPDLRREHLAGGQTQAYRLEE